MKRLSLFISLLTATALVAGASEAQRGPGGPMGPRMAGAAGFGLLQFDANGDGKVTKAEFDAAQRREFAELDGNKDGSATPEEIRTGMEAQRKARHEAALKASFAEMDANKNGQVTEAEFLAAHKDGDGDHRPHFGGRGGPGGPGPMMMRGDRDGPGFGRGERGGRRDGGPPGGPGAPGAPQAGVQGSPPQAGAPRQMRAGPADADNDGKLTFSEFSARPTEAFNRADTNKDGTVTIAELQARTGVTR